jgi:hypothetical protein
MRPNTVMRFLMCGCLALLLGVNADATVLIGADLGELSREAVAIVRGRVAAVEGRWGEGRRSIETIVTLEAERYLKGSLGDAVEFRVPGGELGRFRHVVVGAPEFVVGERVLLFLGARGPSIPYVLGFSQGVFRIARAVDASEWVTTPAFFPAAPAAPLLRGDGARQRMTLAQFEQRVRALAGGAR